LQRESGKESEKRQWLMQTREIVCLKEWLILDDLNAAIKDEL
jgi:hypothetical protein